MVTKISIQKVNQWWIFLQNFINTETRIEAERDREEDKKKKVGLENGQGELQTRNENFEGESMEMRPDEVMLEPMQFTNDEIEERISAKLTSVIKAAVGWWPEGNYNCSIAKSSGK